MKSYKLLFLISILITSVSCITVNPKTSIKRLMDKYPQIISITECWGFDDDDYNSSDLLFYSSVSLDIKMENNKRVFISNIRSSSLKAPFAIYLLGESTFEISHFFGDTINHYIGLPIDFISKNINRKLKSVDDVIYNYDLIYIFTNSLTKLTDIEYLLDIDQKNEIIRGLEYSYSLGKNWWWKYVQPIIVREDEDKWYILNITHDEIPNDYKYKAIENISERELRYIYYKN